MKTTVNQIYERVSIELWFEQNDTDPMTGLQLDVCIDMILHPVSCLIVPFFQDKTLTPVPELLEEINAHRLQNPGMYT